MTLNVFALNCTLKSSAVGEDSSTDRLLGELMAELEPKDCSCEAKTG